MNNELFTLDELIKFGNYLLSNERRNLIINEDNIDKVTDADVRNVFEA